MQRILTEWKPSGGEEIYRQKCPHCGLEHKNANYIAFTLGIELVAAESRLGKILAESFL